ncbi:hypothetical protein PybrP1_007237 [[Pythium] brassicae (nom. inval.)]|nr:hypothetical protein PybrP1_007237 [[Pythium] brassicae (nom. inval.)]
MTEQAQVEVEEEQLPLAIAAADADADARPAKRVRFSTVASSNDVTHLAIVAVDASDKDAPLAGAFFSPRFTYHAFGRQETVQGYEELRVAVLFSAYDFRVCLDVHFTEQEPGADDVVEKISPSLPEGFTLDRAEFEDCVHTAAAAFKPLGACVSVYSKLVDSRERHFEIYEVPLDGDDAAQQLLANLQTMALWFIEGADRVDVADPRWVVYLTYERSEAGGSGAFAPVGYVTLFKFTNPVGRQVSGSGAQMNETHRICQVLVFPTHQRQGHGEHLVQCIWERAVANERVFELTVEDPVPAFSQLRTLVDVKNCVTHGFFALSPSESSARESLFPAQGTTSLQPADIRVVQRALKITLKQVQTCYEVLKLRFVDRADAEQLKKFRLEVKKRLFKLHAEELEGMGSAERRKAFLESAFQALDAQYSALLAKL